MKHTLIILCLSLTTGLSAQNMSDYLPKNASYIISINFAELEAKSKDMDYTRFLEPLIKGARSRYYYGSTDETSSCDLISTSDLVRKPKDFGVDMQSAFYVYSTRINDISGTAYLFKLQNVETFRSQLKTTCHKKYEYQQRHIEQATMYSTKELAVAINGSVALVFVKDYNYYDADYSHDFSANGYVDSAFGAENEADNFRNDSLFYERLNSGKNLDYDQEVENVRSMTDTMITYRAKQRQEAKELEFVNQKFNGIFDLVAKLIIPQHDNMSSDRNFMKAQQGGHDAFAYMNVYSNFAQADFNPFSWNRRYSRDKEELVSSGNRFLTSDMSATYTIDFENGKAVLSSVNSYNKNVYERFRKIYDVKMDKDLFKYIDGENLLGYMSSSVDMKEMGKFYEEFYIELLESLPKRKKEQDIMTGIELFIAFLDKEMLFNTANGNMIFACTGFTDVKVKYTTYDYDDDFQKNETTEELVEKQPKMVFVSGIGNKENARKLFDIFSKFSVFTRLKDNVFAFYGNKYQPVNIFFALTDDAIIITNDANLVQNNLGGYPKNKQMSSDEKKFISKYNFAARINSQKMLEGIKDTYFKNGETLPWFSQMMTSLGNFELYSSKPEKDGIRVTAEVTLKDQSSNALYQILKMMSAADGH